MRCSCQKCGEYMVQDERGLESRCICPVCFSTCSACMGTPVSPKSPQELREELQRRMALDRASEGIDDRDW